jgi:Zn-finger nucleic acid-binding protein
VAPAEVERIVDATARRRLQGLVDQGLPASRGCPACGTVLRAFEVQRVDAWGCPACGAVWFDRGPVEDHVRRVRRRAYGRSSIAARRDVVELGENIQADEVVRGLLAYYALEPRGSSKKD